jgi:hypothetical protein
MTGSAMIDDLIQVARLLEKLEDALPLPAAMTPQLVACLRERYPEKTITEKCRVVALDYAGSEGGIMCELDFGPGNNEDRVLASITHLTFDRRHPLRRAIVAYQKRRTKRLRIVDMSAAERGSLPVTMGRSLAYS